MERTENGRGAAKNFMPVPDISKRFLEFLGGESYPCVGAKAGLSRGSIETHEFGTLGDPDNDQPMLQGLQTLP
jgi:hypothetical protein